MTTVHEGRRTFRESGTARRLDEEERHRVVAAFGQYLETIPEDKRFDRDLFYELLDVVGKSGFGIGSAGLPAYNLLVEGFSQVLDNDVVLSMKQGNVPAASRFVDAREARDYFRHEGHRTVVSRRALQAHADPLLGYTEIDGVGYVVAELSPYEVDLDWTDLTEPDQIAEVVELLGRATAKIHCPPDEDSEHDLVEFQVEDAIAESLQGGAATSPRGSSRRAPGTPIGCAPTTSCSSTPSGTHRRLGDVTTGAGPAGTIGSRALPPAASRP